MLYRHKFITNSSSCSFIAWGIPIDTDIIDNYHEVAGWSEDEKDKWWDDMYNGKFPVLIRTCGYSNRAWAIVTESLLRHLEDEEYIEFDPYIQGDWYNELSKFCDDYHIEWKEPQWFFATVGC